MFVAGLFVIVGICLFAGVQAVIVGLHRSERTLCGLFAALCFVAVAFAAADLRLYSAPSLAAAATALRLRIAAGCIFFPIFVAFVGVYTGRPLRRPWAAIVLLYTGFLVVDLASPYGLLFSSFAAAPPLALPWGEMLPRYVGDPAPISGVYVVADVALCLWALGRARRQYRAGAQRAALMLSSAVGMLLVVILASCLVELLGLASPHFHELGFLGLLLTMSFALGADIRRRADVLEVTVGDLRRQVADRLAAEHQLAHMAYHDDVTGLPNKAQLVELLDASAPAARGGSRALVLLGLDHFKIVNQAAGHLVGDVLLRRVGDRLQAAVPRGGFLARLGGDEFVLVLPATESRQAAIDLARDTVGRVGEELRLPFSVSEHRLHVNTSAGIVIFPAGAVAAEVLLRNADAALQQAKSEGRACMSFFVPEMERSAQRRVDLEGRLRRAIEHESLTLVFQPQVGADGRLVGVESLLRWHDRMEGDIPPGTFIPLCEATGLIHTLGAWALRGSLAALGRWADDEKASSRRLSVNISPWELVRPGFPAEVAAALSGAGVDATCLTLEITEGVLVSASRQALANMGQLRDLGVRLAIDDFGTGYSSLAYLRRLPVSELKIDRSFVAPLEQLPHDPLVASIVSLGRGMGLAVVAEGVETRRQQDSLFELGCSAVQGFVVAPPMEETDLTSWMRAHA